jgi:DNA recombination protein RmuC
MNSTALVLGLVALAALMAAALLITAIRAGASSRSALEAQRALESLRGEIAGRVDTLDRRSAELQGHMTQQLLSVQQLLQERLASQETALREQLAHQATSLQGQTGILQKAMEGTQTTLSQVTEKMGAIQQAAGLMSNLGRDMEELQRLLKSPKARGQMGELGLETLLGDMLPRDRVTYQYGFPDGRKVDAVVHLDKGLLPIDAKFPMEDFQRFVDAPQEERQAARKALLGNLKKKVDDIAKLYIRPGDGTLPLALMYLPAESLYYEAFIAREKDEDDLWDYAYRKSVLPLSPGTLSAYLKTVAMGLKAAAVEQNARQVLDLLTTLERDVRAFHESHEILGKHIANAHQSYDKNTRSLAQFEGHLERAKEWGENAGAAQAGPPDDTRY